MRPPAKCLFIPMKLATAMLLPKIKNLHSIAYLQWHLKQQQVWPPSSHFPNIAPFLLICGQWFTPWKIQHAAPASEVIKSIQGEGRNGCRMPIPPIHHKERGSCATTHGHISGEVKNIRLELNVEVMSGLGPWGHQQVVEGWKYHTWLSQQRTAGDGRRVVQNEISDNRNISEE